MIQVRKSTYRDVEGWTVCGTDWLGRRARVFTPDHDQAERIAVKLRDGYDAGEHLFDEPA